MRRPAPRLGVLHHREPTRAVSAGGRIVAHLSVWTAVLVPTAIEMARGWRPAGDDANISYRAYEVFSRHPPLVGIFATGLAGTGHRLYDLGPLGSWLLAVPVHLDPGQGALWGAALWCGAVLSVTVEALWRTRGWRGWTAGMAMALLVTDLVCQTTLVFANLPWNAYFGLVFFVATIALAWVVAGGRLAWWPVLVCTASVATQSHLVFAVTSVVLVAIAPLLGWAGAERAEAAQEPGAGAAQEPGAVAVGAGAPRLTPPPHRWRWLAVGLAVGLAGWTAPIIEEVTGHPGNITALATNAHRLPTIGLRYGLQTLTIAASPKPIFLTRFPSQFLAAAVFIHPRGPALLGVVVLVALAVIAWQAWRHRRSGLASLATIAFVCCVGAVVSFSSVEQGYLLGVTYLVFCLWVIGTVLWIVWIWAVIEMGLAVRRRRAVGTVGTVSGPAPGAPRGLALFAVLALGALVALTALGASRSVASPWTVVDTRTVEQIRTVSTAIEQAVRPPGPVAFELRIEDGSASTTSRVEAGTLGAADRIGAMKALATGVVYRLTTDGWRTGLSRAISPFFDPPQPCWPVVVVTVRDGLVVSSGVLYPGPPGVGAPCE